MIADAGSFNRCNPKGLRFQPTDEELVDYHLIPKILHPYSDHHYIGDIQNFSQLIPDDLFGLTQKTPDDKEGFFFWPPMKKNNRIVRKGKEGFWSETCRSVSVTAEDGGEEVAKKRVFVFYTGVYPGTRTSWFIHQFEYTASLPCDQDQKEIFLCRIFEQKQKDRVSGKKRKAKSNAQETPAKTRRAKKDDDSFRKKKTKISSAEEAQLDNKDLSLDANKSITTSGEVISRSHHLPSKDNINGISNNMHEGGYPWSSEGLHQSCGSPSYIQNFGDNQQSPHLPSNSTINISTYGEMLGEISNNEDSRYNARSADGSQLSFHMPLALKDDTTNSELLQQSHHLPSNCKESTVSYGAYEEIPSIHQSSTLQGSVDCKEGDSNYQLEADCASTIDHEPDLSSASLSGLHEQGVPTKGLENDHGWMREGVIYLDDLDQSAPSSMYQDILGSQMGNIAPDEYTVHWNTDPGVYSCQGTPYTTDDAYIPSSPFAVPLWSITANTNTP